MFSDIYYIISEMSDYQPISEVLLKAPFCNKLPHTEEFQFTSIF